jgi:hypothetical protein
MDSLDRDCFILYGLGLIAGLTIGIVYALGRSGVISKPIVILFIRIYSALTNCHIWINSFKHIGLIEPEYQYLSNLA